MKESPRWLASKGRYAEADAIVTRLEESAIAAGHKLEEPRPVPVKPKGTDSNCASCSRASTASAR